MSEAGAWTDERVELLKKLWNDGLSASQIAAELGNVTRNAVIGKVHRLGLSGRAKSPGSATPRPRKPAARPPSHPAGHQNGGSGLTRGNTALAPQFAPQIEAEAQSRVVGLYTPAGLPLMEVEVQADTVRLKIGPEPVRRGALRRLEEGREFKLELHDKKEHFALLGR